MQCSSCQHENHALARFCGGCGQALQLECASCGAKNASANRFCDGCGAALSERKLPGNLHATPRAYTPQHLTEKIMGSHSALEGERKQVTVLFCDMVNSTDLAQRVGADAMHKLLNAMFELALAEVHKVEGTVNQFLGDGFMALFGAPVAHEDHVRRALLCALAIRNRLQEAARGAQSELANVQVRMGLNTGMVVVGTIGDSLRMDYTAVGDTTHIAARLQQLGKAGQILVSEAVATGGQSFFEFTSLGKRAVKGIREPVALFELVKTRTREEFKEPSKRLGIGSPLVGRDEELAQLHLSVAELREGQGGILLLTGEPGAGKSRLLTEARRQLSDGKVLWLEGRAVSYGRSLSYLPFIEILKAYLGIGDDDSDDEGWRKLREGVGALFGDRAPEVLPYLAPLLALRALAEYEERVKYLDGPGLRRQVFLCMRQLFELLARRQPVVLLLEDWHWADQSSIELAEHLLPLTGSAPLLAVFPTRPDPDGPSARIRQFGAGEAGRRPREIVLAPLAQGQSAELMANLVGAMELPVSLRDQILRKTEGNPFFMEEVIRTLVADGVLVRDARDQSWQLVRHVEQVQLPDTVQGLILARIDRLEEDVKQALKLASVIGRSFFNRVLEVISSPQPNLDGSLAQLEHAELIRPCQQIPELEYIFKHALVQEAAYGSILAENRRDIHRRVAQAIETLFKDRIDEFTSLLAHHYTCAQDSDKAQEYLFKAGDQAGKMAADAEALEHFRLAEGEYIKAYGDRLQPLQRAALARKVGVALYSGGHYAQALEQFSRALAQLGLPYPGTRGGVLRVLLKNLAAHALRRWRRRLGMPAAKHIDLETAKEIGTICHYRSWIDYSLNKERMFLDCVLELYAGECSPYEMAEARGLSSLGFAFMTFGARGLSRRYGMRARRIAQRTGNASAIAFAGHALGMLDLFDGRWQESDDNFAKATRGYLDTGDMHRAGGAGVMWGMMINMHGDLARSREIAGELIANGQGAADPQLESWGHQLMGYAELPMGPLDQAVAHLRIGSAMAARIPAWDNFLYQVSLLIKCLVLQGDFAQAASELKKALELSDVLKTGTLFDKTEIFTGRATCALAIAEFGKDASGAARLRQAQQDSRDAVRCARKMPLWLPQALRLQGTARWLAGDKSGAQTDWAESLQLAERFAFPLEVARTQLEMGSRLGDSGMVEQACAEFRTKGAQVFLALGLHAQARLASQASSDKAADRRRYAQAIDALQLANAGHDLARAQEALAQLQVPSA